MATIHELIERCASSRETRRKRLAYDRLFYLRGTDQTGAPARYNKLKAHLKRVQSYLYAPESTRFALALPRHVRGEFLEHSVIAAEEWAQVWRDSGADVAFSTQVLWSLIFGTTLSKIIPDSGHGAQAAYVFAGDFGVNREDLPALDQQESLCHWFQLTLPEVRRYVKGLPESEKIIAWAEANSTPEPSSSVGFPSLLNQVIVSSAGGGDFFGSGKRGSLDLSLTNEEPENLEPLVEASELWEKRERKVGRKTVLDYWVTTVIGDWPILQRWNPILPHVEQPLGQDLPGENPFVKVSPNPLLDYAWGLSELADLTQLQMWREARFVQIDQIFQLQLDPSRFFSGVTLSDEKMAALRKPGGYAASPMPGAKVEEFKPDMPTAAFEVIHEIDTMFNDAGGVPPVLQGQGEAGVRAGNQLGTMAGIGVGRLREQAAFVEDALETLATRMFHLLQRRDETAYPLQDGKTFLLAQLPAETTVKVSAHSASPVFAEQLMAKAQLLLKAGAIDLPTFVDLVDPPNRELLMEQARKLQEAQAAQKKEIMEIQREKALRGPRR